MAAIPEKYSDLLTPGKKAFAHLATLMKDGSPQVTPVWLDYADGMIRVYLTHGEVVGFAHQFPRGLRPAEAGEPPPGKVFEVAAPPQFCANLHDARCLPHLYALLKGQRMRVAPGVLCYSAADVMAFLQTSSSQPERDHPGQALRLPLPPQRNAAL